jgi:hypothetical protein
MDRDPDRMGVRIAIHIFRVLLGDIVLASIHWLGPLAWLGLLPLVWGALGLWSDYRTRHPADY